MCKTRQKLDKIIFNNMNYVVGNSFPNSCVVYAPFKCNWTFLTYKIVCFWFCNFISQVCQNMLSSYSKTRQKTIKVKSEEFEAAKGDDQKGQKTPCSFLYRNSVLIHKCW